MSFFCQASRFIKPKHMSPGPATYRSPKAGFDSFNWKPTDVRSPDFAHRRQRSTQLFLVGHSGKSKEAASDSVVWDSNKTDGTNGTLDTMGQNVVMSEVYGRLVRTVKIEISETKKENDEKEDFLLRREKVHQECLDECRNKDSIRGRDLNDTILNGEIAVKIIRVPTGRYIGPGSYEQDQGLYAKANKGSHNMKADKQFQELTSISCKKTPVKANRLITTFYEETGKSSLSRLFKEHTKTSFATPTSAKRTPHKNTSPRNCEDSRTVTTNNDSRENLAKPVREFAASPPIYVEHPRLIPRPGEVSRKNVVTPDFQHAK